MNWLLSKLRQVHITRITSQGHVSGERVDEIYLSRYWFLGRQSTRCALMLHRMWKVDHSRCHHDHPWSFWTLILKGGYEEEVTREDGSLRTRYNRPGTLLFRPAEHTHRVSGLPNGNCWTLVLRFKKRRHWGFWSTKLKGKWIGWQQFVSDQRNGVLWCGDDK